MKKNGLNHGIINRIILLGACFFAHLDANNQEESSFLTTPSWIDDPTKNSSQSWKSSYADESQEYSREIQAREIENSDIFSPFSKLKALSEGLYDGSNFDSNDSSPYLQGLYNSDEECQSSLKLNNQTIENASDNDDLSEVDEQRNDEIDDLDLNFDEENELQSLFDQSIDEDSLDPDFEEDFTNKDSSYSDFLDSDPNYQINDANENFYLNSRQLNETARQFPEQNSFEIPQGIFYHSKENSDNSIQILAPQTLLEDTLPTSKLDQHMGLFYNDIHLVTPVEPIQDQTLSEKISSDSFMAPKTDIFFQNQIYLIDEQPFERHLESLTTEQVTHFDKSSAEYIIENNQIQYPISSESINSFSPENSNDFLELSDETYLIGDYKIKTVPIIEEHLDFSADNLPSITIVEETPLINFNESETITTDQFISDNLQGISDDLQEPSIIDSKSNMNVFILDDEINPNSIINIPAPVLTEEDIQRKSLFIFDDNIISFDQEEVNRPEPTKPFFQAEITQFDVPTSTGFYINDEDIIVIEDKVPSETDFYNKEYFTEPDFNINSQKNDVFEPDFQFQTDKITSDNDYELFFPDSSNDALFTDNERSVPQIKQNSSKVDLSSPHPLRKIGAKTPPKSSIGASSLTQIGAKKTLFTEKNSSIAQSEPSIETIPSVKVLNKEDAEAPKEQFKNQINALPDFHSDELERDLFDETIDYPNQLNEKQQNHAHSLPKDDLPNFNPEIEQQLFHEEVAPVPEFVRFPVKNYPSEPSPEITPHAADRQNNNLVPTEPSLCIPEQHNLTEPSKKLSPMPKEETPKVSNKIQTPPNEQKSQSPVLIPSKETETQLSNPAISPQTPASSTQGNTPANLNGQPISPTQVNPLDQNLEKTPENTTLTKPQDITINFNNIAMAEFIRFISKISNKNFIFDEADLQFNVSIVSEEPTSLENIMAALLQELEVHDLSLIEDGNNILIHRNPKIKGPAHIVSSDIPGSENTTAGLVTQVFRMNTLDPTKASEILLPLLSGTAQISVLRDSNTLVITDVTASIKKISLLLKSLDAPNNGMEIDRYVARNTLIDSLINVAQQILLPISQGNPIVFVPYNTTNSVFIISNPFLVSKAIAILKHLDGNEAPGENPLNLSSNGLGGGAGSAESAAAAARAGAAGARGQAGNELNPGSISPYSRYSEALPPGHIERTLFFIHKLQFRNGDQIQIALQKVAQSLQSVGNSNSDLVSAINAVQWLETSNSLVFTGTISALEKIKELLHEIDVPLRQVFIEMLILDATITDSLTLGVQWGSRFGGGNTSGAQAFLSGASVLPVALDTGQLTGTPDASLLGRDDGFHLGIIGDHLTHCGLRFNSIGALVDALHNNTKTNIILNPKILTEDNHTAEIFVGTTDRFKTQSVSNNQGSILTNNFTFLDVGTRLKVTPLIGNNDIITLDIEQEVTSAAAGANQTFNQANVDVNLVPVTNKSKTTTKVHLPNRAFLVMSGLIQGENDRTRNEVPCLGGIPIIGAAFSRKFLVDNKRNLMIFIRPIIIDTDEELNEITRREQHIYKERNKYQRSWNYEIEESLDLFNIKHRDPDDRCSPFKDVGCAEDCPCDY